MTICPGKDGSGVACSHPQSICIARGFVQWGPRSPSGWAYQQSASFVQLSAMLRPPAPAACIPASPPLLSVCSWVQTCHCTHTHRLASPSPRPRHLPTSWPLAIGVGASILKDGIADCSGSDLHVLSFNVF